MLNYSQASTGRKFSQPRALLLAHLCMSDRLTCKLGSQLPLLSFGTAHASDLLYGSPVAGYFVDLRRQYTLVYSLEREGERDRTRRVNTPGPQRALGCSGRRLGPIQ